MADTPTAPLIVAIDGPSGVGKSTTSRRVARALGIPHIDTGAMYRAIGLAALLRGVDLHDQQALELLARETSIEFVPGERGRVILDGTDISDRIRTPEISMAASHVSAVPGVRRVLVALQQQMGHRSGGVLEGRDIGTKVFPETPHKFFLTARPEIRAQRRYRELLAKGQALPMETVLSESLKRDEQDASRADSPMTHDESYTILDTSDMTLDQVVAAIVDNVRARSR